MIKAIFNFFVAWLVLFASIGFCLYQLTRPNFLADQAQKIGLYDRLSGELTTIMPISMGNISLTSTEVHDIATAAIDQTTFYNFFSKGANAYIDWLTGRTDTLAFSYPMAGIKTNLQNALAAKLIAKYNGLPICTTAQLKGWQATDGLPSCQLPNNNVLAGSVDGLLSQQATKVTNQIPDTLTAPAPTPSLLKDRYYTIQALKIIELIWVATAAVIGLYLLISRSGAFLSLAFIFLLAGILEVGFGFIGWDWLTRLITDSLNTLNQTTISAVVDIVSASMEVLKTTLGNLSIISLSIGGFFLVAGLFYKFKKPLSVI